MCGIAGWVGESRSLEDYPREKIGIVSSILDRQAHRGPDARGLWSDKRVPAVLGHNRLSIIELSEAGAQPMVSSDGRWIISYNGELYNYKNIKNQLEKKHGVIFRGHSDTEVFLNGFIHYGVDEFLRLADGMFAVAIYDKKNNELFLLRDRVGEKPLYYSLIGKELYFSSELKALAKAIPIDISVSTTALQLYLMLRYVPAPHSMLKGIFKVQPGHYIRYRCGGELVQIPYYSWDPHASEIPANQKNYREVVNATEKLLIKSLETRLMSDVPLGFFLSGGIDSTLSASLIRKYFGKEIYSYTVRFEGETDSEHTIAEKTASVIGAKHFTKTLKQSDLYNQSVEYIRQLDEPNGDRSLVPTFLLCKHARSEVTVALGGDGGDELFSGYTRYPGLNKTLSSNCFFSPLEVLKSYFSERLPVFGPVSLSLFDRVEPDTDLFLTSLSMHLVPPTNTEQAIRFVDFKSYLPGAVLSKVDRMSMLTSLEVRTPFFSPSLLEMASRLPHEFLHRGNEMKPILRDICRKIGLGHVADIPKKGFGMPQEFLSLNKDQLVNRAGKALKFMDTCDSINIPNFGKKLSKYAGANMNALWATIVLGEWFEHLEGSIEGVD